MIFLVSQKPEALRDLGDALRPRTRRELVAVDNGFAALRLLELNPIELVVIDVTHTPAAWLRAFARDNPDARCLVLGEPGTLLEEARGILSESTTFVPMPCDFDEVAARLDEAGIDPSSEDSDLVAAGLEDLLTLFSLSRKDAELFVTAGPRQGRLHVQAGFLVHAQTEVAEGSVAAYDVLSWHNPRVESRPIAANVPTTLMLPIGECLHEAARRQDERARFLESAEVRELLRRVSKHERCLGVALVGTLAHEVFGTPLGSAPERVADGIALASPLLRAWGASSPARRYATLSLDACELRLLEVGSDVTLVVVVTLRPDSAGAGPDEGQIGRDEATRRSAESGEGEAPAFEALLRQVVDGIRAGSSGAGAGASRMVSSDR